MLGNWSVSLVPLNGGHGVSARGFWFSWPVEPFMALVLFLSVAIYTIGRSRLLTEAPTYPFPRWRAVCFYAGIAAIAMSLMSPIAAYSEQLFSMHMVQHLLLLLVAPPLVLLGQPFLPALWSLPKTSRKSVARWFRPGAPLATVRRLVVKPVFAVVAYVVTVAVWHIPVFYDAAQGRTLTHDLEHFMFYGTAALYWWPIVAPASSRPQLTTGWAIPYLLPPFLEGMLIGALLTFSSEPLYSTYAELSVRPVWGLDWLADQELGGLIMWVPGGLFFLIPLIGLLSRVLNNESSERPRRAMLTNGS